MAPVSIGFGSGIIPTLDRVRDCRELEDSLLKSSIQHGVEEVDKSVIVSYGEDLGFGEEELELDDMLVCSGVSLLKFAEVGKGVIGSVLVLKGCFEVSPEGIYGWQVYDGIIDCVGCLPFSFPVCGHARAHSSKDEKDLIVDTGVGILVGQEVVDAVLTEPEKVGRVSLEQRWFCASFFRSRGSRSRGGNVDDGCGRWLLQRDILYEMHEVLDHVH